MIDDRRPLFGIEHRQVAGFLPGNLGGKPALPMIAGPVLPLVGNDALSWSLRNTPRLDEVSGGLCLWWCVPGESGCPSPAAVLVKMASGL